MFNHKSKREKLKRKTKFWIYMTVGTCTFTPFFIASVMVGIFVLAATQIAWFLVFCYLNYRFVYKKEKAKYPLAPPEGRMDVYFPRTNIPRPIYEDVRKYPEAFGKRKKSVEKTRKRRKSKRQKP
ncbi:MAG: hypothetical protein ACQXXG_01120 [Candidatus Bathyarchaeia archaeon]|nr:hypothetical protein [Candidatus Bathyarchaeota archaeon A05DMB-3]